MSKLVMTFELMHLQAKGNADQVLVEAEAAPGVPGLLWLEEVPQGGAQCRAVSWAWSGGYPMFQKCAVDNAARFAAVLKPLGLRLYLDGVEVQTDWDGEELRLVPVKTDTEEALERR